MTSFDRMLHMEISSNTMKMKFEYTENSEMLDSINKAGRAFEQTNLNSGTYRWYSRTFE